MKQLLPLQSTSYQKVQWGCSGLERNEGCPKQVQNPVEHPQMADIEGRSCLRNTHTQTKKLACDVEMEWMIWWYTIMVNWRLLYLRWLRRWYASLLIRSLGMPSDGFRDISSPLSCFRISTVQHPMATWNIYILMIIKLMLKIRYSKFQHNYCRPREEDKDVWRWRVKLPCESTYFIGFEHPWIGETCYLVLRGKNGWVCNLHI